MWDLNFETLISHRGLHSGLRPQAPTSMRPTNQQHAKGVTQKYKQMFDNGFFGMGMLGLNLLFGGGGGWINHPKMVN